MPVWTFIFPPFWDFSIFSFPSPKQFPSGPSPSKTAAQLPHSSTHRELNISSRKHTCTHRERERPVSLMDPARPPTQTLTGSTWSNSSKREWANEKQRQRKRCRIPLLSVDFFGPKRLPHTIFPRANERRGMFMRLTALSFLSAAVLCF